MSFDVEYIEDFLILRGTAKVTDDSFDHAHGKHHEENIEIENFKIFIEIGGNEIDVTVGFELPHNTHHYNRLKECLLIKANDQLEASA